MEKIVKYARCLIWSGLFKNSDNSGISFQIKIITNTSERIGKWNGHEALEGEGEEVIYQELQEEEEEEEIKLGFLMRCDENKLKLIRWRIILVKNVIENLLTKIHQKYYQYD